MTRSVTLLYFGPLKDLMGTAQQEIDLPATIADRAALVEFLADGNTFVIEELSSTGVRLVLDNKIAVQDGDLSSVSEIAFLPPLSGG